MKKHRIISSSIMTVLTVMYFVFPSLFVSENSTLAVIAPLALAALISGIAGLAKTGIGAYQLGQSKKYADTKRPDYNIPEEYKALLSSAQAQANQTQLPGQGLAEEKLAASTSRGITQAKQVLDSPASLLGYVAGTTSDEQAKIRDFGIAAGENFNTNQGVLRSALGIMGEQKATKQQWEEILPYQEAMATASSLQEAGTGNVVAGLGDAAGVAMSAIGTSEYMKALNNQSAAQKSYYDAMIASFRLSGDKDNDASSTSSDGSSSGSSSGPTIDMPTDFGSLVEKSEGGFSAWDNPIKKTAEGLGNGMKLSELAALELNKSKPGTLSTFDILNLYKKKPMKGILNDPYSAFKTKSLLSSYGF